MFSFLIFSVWGAVLQKTNYGCCCCGCDGLVSKHCPLQQNGHHLLVHFFIHRRWSQVFQESGVVYLLDEALAGYAARDPRFESL